MQTIIQSLKYDNRSANNVSILNTIILGIRERIYVNSDKQILDIEDIIK
jgi:hypothetical protein